MSRSFRDEDLSTQIFDDQDLADSTFERCGLAGASFRHTNLSGTLFTGCHAFSPDIRGEGSDDAATADFSYADLKEALFEDCDLTAAVFLHASAYELCFRRCQLQGVDLSGCDFTLPIGHSAQMSRFTMEHCNFAYGDLSNTNARGCALTDNRMVESVLNNCTLENADLTGSDLCNISGHGMDLTGADLRRTTLNNLDPRSINLTGVTVGLSQALAILDTLGVVIDPEAD